MNTRTLVLGAAIALCILLLSGIFLVLAIGLVYNIRQDYVAAAPSPIATTPSPPVEAVLEMDPTLTVGNYAQAIVDYITMLAPALRTMNNLLAASVVDAQAWAPQVNTSQVVLLYAQADLQQVTPPSDLLQLHNGLLAIAGQCADMLDRAGRSLNANDLVGLAQLADPLRTCHAGFKQANAAVRQLDPGLARVPEVAQPVMAIRQADSVEVAPVAQPPAPTVAIGGNPNAFQCAGGCISPPDFCRIKGNISAEGERIYHEPGMSFYERTEIDPGQGERWFCTGDEAVASGWRRSQQ